MRDIYERDAEFLFEAHQLVLHLLTELEVERAERLIEQQHTRLVHDRPCHRYPLLLTARKLVDAAVLETIQVDEFEGVRHFLLYLGLRSVLYPEAECDVLAHAHMREERVVLEHGIDRSLIGRHVRDVFAFEVYSALIRLFEACYDAQGRRFAAARRSQQRDEFILVHDKVKAFYYSFKSYQFAQ